MERWGNLSTILDYPFDFERYINTCILEALPHGMEA